MTRTGRTPAALALSALVLGALASAGAAPATTAPLAQAVVTFDGAPVALPGVRVVRHLPALDAAVVRGTAGDLGRLARVAGVRGLAPDVPLVLTGGAAGHDGVPAAEGLDVRPGQTGAGVRVAVVDTGVSDSAVLSRASGRLVDAVDTSTGQPRTRGVFDDGHGHGTFMASVIAGGPPTGSDAPVGVAPGATVLVVKVARQNGSTSLSRVLGGLDWVVENASRVDVANLSLSHERPDEAYGPDPLTDAVERVRDAGVTVVVSSGNQPDRVGDPGFDPRIVSVGAADLRAGTDEAVVAGFSGSGEVAGVARPDVVANGVAVLGHVPPRSVIGRSVPPRPDGLVRGTGTSQSAAVVSGAAALLLEQHPQATPAQVKASLRDAALDLEDGARDGRGLLQVPTRLVGDAAGVGPGPDGPATDHTGESRLQASSWSASSWSASSWSASSWSASSWSASSWSASSWSASSWSASSWS